MSRFEHSSGVAPPTLQQWSVLALMQRSVLVKLSRGGQDNVNFIPAIREFGLLPLVIGTAHDDAATVRKEAL